MASKWATWKAANREYFSISCSLKIRSKLFTSFKTANCWRFLRTNVSSIALERCKWFNKGKKLPPNAVVIQLKLGSFPKCSPSAMIRKSNINCWVETFPAQLRFAKKKVLGNFWKKMLKNLVVVFTFSQVYCDQYDEKVQFVLYNKDKSSISTFNTSLKQLGCLETCNFSFITHGWMGSDAAWIPDLVSNLTYYRKGCVLFMNYTYYSDTPNYLDLKQHFKPLTNLVTRKLQQIRSDGISSDCMFLYGFSFGGRIMIEAALQYGPRKISMIDSEKQIRISSESNHFYFQLVTWLVPVLISFTSLTQKEPQKMFSAFTQAIQREQEREIVIKTGWWEIAENLSQPETTWWDFSAVSREDAKTKRFSITTFVHTCTILPLKTTLWPTITLTALRNEWPKICPSTLKWVTWRRERS